MDLVIAALVKSFSEFNGLPLRAALIKTIN